MNIVRSLLMIVMLNSILPSTVACMGGEPVNSFDGQAQYSENAALPDSVVIVVALSRTQQGRMHLCRSEDEQWIVTAVSCEGTSIGDAECRVLSAMASLEEITLIGTQVTDVGIGSFRELPNLRYLDLRGANVSLEGLRTLSRLRQLQVLDVRGTGIQFDELNELRKRFPSTEIYSDWGTAKSIGVSQLALESRE